MVLAVTACKPGTATQETTVQLSAYAKEPWQKVLQRFSTNQTPLLVTNFWATWCAPCVKEMPHFERLAQEYKDRGVHVLLVSLDSPKEADTLVVPFALEKKLTNPIVVVDTTNYERFIDGVTPMWQGGLPATALYNAQGQQVAFHDGDFTYETLKAFIEPHLPKP